jgi:hypothetical protein
VKITWVRGEEDVRFNRPHTFFIIGTRGSGKSACLEHIAEGYLSGGHTVLDLFGSRDGEGLAWLRSEHAKNKRILLIHGDNVSVGSSFDTKNISKLCLNDFTDYDILISASPLYGSIDDEFFHVNKIIDVLYKRLSWKNLVFMITRESANLYYSRLRVSPNQLAAKTESTYLIREGRHCGIALGLDTLKFTSIDADIRAVVDYFIFKSQGVQGFPDDKQWLYGYFNPATVRSMPPKYFFIVSAKGPLGIGKFPLPPWHKQERENILRSVGLKVEYGDRIDYGESRGVYKTVGDQEHLDIINTYFGGVSMGKIAKKLDRSAATVHTQIHSHDESIDKQGYCAECRRLKGTHETHKTDSREATAR